METIILKSRVNGQEWGATFSKEITAEVPEDYSLFRFALSRQWNHNRAPVAFIGLNPSTATHLENDPTVLRCMNDAREWGCGGMYMLNLWPFRSMSPDVMKRYYKHFAGTSQLWNAADTENQGMLVSLCTGAAVTIAAWSSHGAWLGQGEKIYNILTQNDIPLKCYGVNANGEAKHRLYLKNHLPLVNYSR